MPPRSHRPYPKPDSDYRVDPERILARIDKKVRPYARKLIEKGLRRWELRCRLAQRRHEYWQRDGGVSDRLRRVLVLRRVRIAYRGIYKLDLLAEYKAGRIGEDDLEERLRARKELW